MEAKKISNNLWREYEYTDGYVIRIEHPVTLYIAGVDRGHRVYNGEVVTYVPPGWRKLTWEPVNQNKPVTF